MQLVVFNVVGHVRVNSGVRHVEGHVVLHPVDHIIGNGGVTGQSEVFIVNWNCVVSDHY